MKERLNYFDEDLADVMHDGGKKMNEQKQEVKLRGKRKKRHYKGKLGGLV